MTADDPNDAPRAQRPADPDAGGAGAAEDAILGELRDVLDRRDPVPPGALAGARGAYAWRTIDAELAELQFDSSLDAAGVRGMAWPRQLSFEAREVAIEVEVDHDRLVGQVVPPAELDLVLTDSTGEARTTRSDQVGHFVFTEVERGTLRITARLADGSVTTQWFTL